MEDTVKKKFMLVDASNHFHRAYNMPGVDLRAPDGFPTNGLHGFFQILFNVERKYKPDFILLVFDKGKSFRRDISSEYKANRTQKSNEFKMQWDEIGTLCRMAGYPVYAKDDGFEADDVIGTMAVSHQEQMDIQIFSGDKDFAQLVNENISLIQPGFPAGFKVYNKEAIERKYKVKAERVLDVFTLVGDKSDNVLGVDGVGLATAAKYINKYGTWENVIKSADTIGGKRGQKIKDSESIVKLAYKLIKIATDVPLEFTQDDLSKSSPEVVDLYKKCVRFGLKSLITTFDLKSPVQIEIGSAKKVCTEQQLKAVVSEITIAGECSLDILFSNGDALSRRILSISLCWGDGNIAQIPIRRTTECEQSSLFQKPTEYCDSLEILWRMIGDEKIKKYVHNLKAVFSYVMIKGSSVKNIARDIMLMDYLEHVNHSDHSLKNIAQRRLFVEISSLLELIKKYGETNSIPSDVIRELSLQRAKTIWLLRDSINLSNEMEIVYKSLELPCIEVLAEMENSGIQVNFDQFTSFTETITKDIEAIEEFVEREVGRKINLKSPKQLSKLLYEERGHTPTKKNKTGASTDEKSLRQLMTHSDDVIIPKILEFREISKVKSTYLEPLPRYIAADGRIHANFHQTGTATGRLSSSEPNLQNIPIRKAWGKKIRECFVAAEGKLLISADYSQIEMRILAHYCKEGPLVEAFLHGEDIHRRTAIEIAGGELFYNDGLRSVAKMINYGLIYGMSAFRLSRELEIPMRDAQRYIDSYFTRYPQVKKYLEMSVDEARVSGCSKTLFGRQRPILGINSPDSSRKDAAERMALNAPIQGTAADIMKIAMKKIYHKLKQEYPTARIVLQVHDELVIEVFEKDASMVSKIVEEEMIRAASLVVPLEVNISIGASWGEIH
jgi:DNA polymerase I